MPNPPKLNTKEADQLAKSKYVKDYNYISNTFGISDGLKLVGASEGEEEGKGKREWRLYEAVQAPVQK